MPLPNYSPKPHHHHHHRNTQYSLEHMYDKHAYMRILQFTPHSLYVFNHPYIQPFNHIPYTTIPRIKSCKQCTYIYIYSSGGVVFLSVSYTKTEILLIFLRLLWVFLVPHYSSHIVVELLKRTRMRINIEVWGG